MQKGFWKNALKGLVLLGAAAYFLLWLFFGGSTFYKVIGESWDIVLPEGEEIYSYTTPPDFHGDGDRYHVIGYNDHMDLSQIVPWEERMDGGAVEALYHIWRYDDFQPDEVYLPYHIQEPYGYFAKSKNGHGNQIVMIWAKQAELGGKVYEQVIFIGEMHS